MTEFLRRIALKLGANINVDKPVFQLDQGMGGGKSHACIGAYHMAKSPVEFWQTSIGEKTLAGARERYPDLPLSLGNPHIVVLSCDSMTPGAPVPELDGPVAYTLYERFLHRLLGEGDAYEAYQPYFSSKAEISRAIRSVGRPVLIIIDEILNYFQALDSVKENNPGLAQNDLAFLRALSEAVAATPNCAAVIVMIRSEHDTTALSKEFDQERGQIEGDLRRNGNTYIVNEPGDFADILRRRLFEAGPEPGAVRAAVEAFQPILADVNWRSRVLEPLNASWLVDFPAHVERCYPFHPQLMAMAEEEWAKHSGFQKVRSTIKIFAAAVHALARRPTAGEWAPVLIGLGDLPLSDSTTREQILDSGLIPDIKVRANYRSLLQTDIIDVTGTKGTAHLLDQGRKLTLWHDHNPRVAERAATVLFITSIVPSRGSRHGASDVEIAAALAVPDALFSATEAEGVISEVVDNERGLATADRIAGTRHTRPHYYLSLRHRLPALLRSLRGSVLEEERDALIAETVGSELKRDRGPFDRTAFVALRGQADVRRAVADVLKELDQPRTTRLLVLDPTILTMRNGQEEATRQLIESALGLGPEPIPLTWASSMIFAVAYTQQRGQMRNLATEVLALRRVSDIVAPSEEDAGLLMEAAEALTRAEPQFRGTVRRGFQHVFFLQQAEEGMSRECVDFQLTPNDAKTQSALHGGDVWANLAERQKVYAEHHFTYRALLANLRERDFERPLSELRDAFWQDPRLSLLPYGDRELKQAIFDAVRQNLLRVVRGDGEEVFVTAPSDISLGESLKLAPPRHPEPIPDPDPRPDPNPTPGPDPRPDPGPKPPGSAIEKRLGIIIQKELRQDTSAAEPLGTFLRKLWDSIDRGHVSQVNMQVQLVVDNAQAQAIADLADQAGLRVTMQDYRRPS
ncbi:DUF499 domain-containing protein [Nonomuraea sp. NPDC059007]|uniref:DUF499 domain-containing protein n=1 Tax=Nonomuraea sp. NPDC059007 TaxID=3346692 RepID=UPI00369AB36D